MSSRGHAACKTVAVKNSKQTLESCEEPLPVSEVTPDGLTIVDKCCTIKVTFETKRRKRTSTMVSSSPNRQKAADNKRKPMGSGDAHHNWGRILREQNRPTVKQSLQQLSLKNRAPKSQRQGSESKEVKKHKEPQSQVKHELHHHLDEIPVKQSAQQRKAEENPKETTPHIGNPSSTSIGSSIESIIVLDRAVQCGGIFDYPDDRFGGFNPVHTLGFLMKELEHLVKDEKASKILTDMEQVLFWIPMEMEKPATADLEAITIRRKLKVTMLQLEETSKKMNAMCEGLCGERDSLERQVKVLKQELEEAVKVSQAKEESLNRLREEVKSYEKIITDLRTNLNEQMELARQRYLEMQYLTLEKDKHCALSSYKDTLLIELRNAVKDVQSHIAEQLTGIKESRIQEETSNPQMSLDHGGQACSPTSSTSSRESNTPTSWQDISDISLSTIDPHPSTREVQRYLQEEETIVASAEKIRGASEKKRSKGTKESKIRDSTHLKFVSLPGEFPNSIFLPRKDLGCTESNELAAKTKENTGPFGNKKTDNARQTKGCESEAPSAEFLHQSVEKTEDKEANRKSSQRPRKPFDSTKKQLMNRKSSAGISNLLKSNFPNNLISSTVTEQFQNMFDDIRLQTKIPVNLPSPPRNYPHPEFSDSTLPSISVASEMNVIQ